MLNWAHVWTRLKRLPAFAQMHESDFRPITYVQTFAGLGSLVTSANVIQAFPGGAIILGISAGAYLIGQAPDAQTARNRQLFSLNLSYSNNESLTPGGPVLADVLMGGGDANVFPSRELVMAPNQQLNCQAGNLTTGSITVQVAYHSMVYRFAS
jgi:hypothetical protein